MTTSTTRRHHVGWILYDFANSTYHLMIPTVLVPLYFREYLAGNVASPDFWWALLISVPVVFAGVINPFVGAITDILKARLGFLMATAALAIVLGSLVAWTSPATVLLAGGLFGLSYFFFILSLGLYDSFLPLIERRPRRGRLSGLGWGLGYLGGIVALAAVYPLLRDVALPEDARAFRESILLVCGLFALFALFAFFLLRGVEDRPIVPGLGSGDVGVASKRWVGEGFRRTAETIRNWRSRKNMFKVLGSYYLANDGLATMLYFTSIYAATTLGFTSQEILMLFVIVQVVGAPASIIGGYAADRWGARPILYIALSIWCVLTVGFALGEGLGVFYALSVGTGMVIGTTPAVYRALLADYVRDERTAEVYGFNSFASRASAIGGPILFGVISSWTGNQRLAVLTLLVFYLGAGLLLGTVEVEAEREVA